MGNNKNTKDQRTMEYPFRLADGKEIFMLPEKAKELDSPEGSVNITISANMFHILLNSFYKINGDN